MLLQLFREFVISLSISGTDTHTPLPLTNINNQYNINIKRMIIIDSIINVPIYFGVIINFPQLPQAFSTIPIIQFAFAMTQIIVHYRTLGNSAGELAEFLCHIFTDPFIIPCGHLLMG